MFVITHALVPVVLAQAVALAAPQRVDFRKRDYAAIMLAGALPDLLDPHISLADRLSSWTHTLWFALAWIPITLALTRWWWKPPSPITFAAVVVLAVPLHLAADAISGGIGWLYPWKKEVIGTRLVPPDDWFAWDGWMTLTTACLGLIIAYRRRAAWLNDDGHAPDAEMEE